VGCSALFVGVVVVVVVGAREGLCNGFPEGLFEGITLGSCDGLDVGTLVDGFTVGESVTVTR